MNYLGKMLCFKKQISAIPLLLFCIVLSAQNFGEYTDVRDGKVYKTIQIGDQVWMAENLNYSSESARAIF